MSERYSRLFALPEDLYCAGSPVVIAAGTLLKDNQNGKVIAQLKLRSIFEKTIKAVKVKLNLFDTAGNPVGDSVEYSYLDLNAARDAEFGQKSPIAVTDAKSRSYQAAVTEVVFADQSVWTANDGNWEPLAKHTPLSIADPELLKQYQMHYGSGAKYAAKAEKDLWHCTCGALNHESESCHICGHSLAELQSVDMAKLTAEKDARLEEVARKAAEEKAAADAQKKKETKILAIVIPTVCAVVAIVLLITNVIIPNNKYNAAVALMDAGRYEEAIVAFEAMDGYKDSVQRISDCEQGIVDREIAILEGQYRDAVALMDAGNYEEAASAFEALGDFKDSVEKAAEATLTEKYYNAVALMESGDFDSAIPAFEALGDFKDSADCIGQMNYSIAESLLESGDEVHAAMAFGRAVGYKDAWERSCTLWAGITPQVTVNAAPHIASGVRTNGTIVASTHRGKSVTDWYNVNWSDVISISTSQNYILGLKADGTVLSSGQEKPNTSLWTDIVAVTAGDNFYAGLKADGTIVPYKWDGWDDLIAISASPESYSGEHMVGLKSDGTVIVYGTGKLYGADQVNTWKDIIAVSAGWVCTIGLKSDGTCVGVGYNNDGRCNVGNWKNIVAISAGYSHTVGLRADGTVVATGYGKNGQCDVSSWRNIVAIDADEYCTVGLRADGTVLVAGKDYYDERIPGWTDNMIP